MLNIGTCDKKLQYLFAITNTLVLTLQRITKKLVI